MRLFSLGPVVQRPSIRPCQGRDRRFESGRDRQTEQVPMRSPSGLRTGARDLTGLRAGLPALSCRAPSPKMLDSASRITRMRTARMVGVAALVEAACTATAAVTTRAQLPQTLNS